MKKKYKIKLFTEEPHPLSVGLDLLPAEKILELFLDDHRSVIKAIEDALPKIAILAKVYASTYRNAGRIFYVGAGTSGRLALLDAVELPPTFGIMSHRVQAIIAGGKSAMYKAIEAAEDDKVAGRLEIAKRAVGPKDLVIGVSASGETPFVLGAIEEAHARGAKTAGIINNPNTTLERKVHFPIIVPTGPELIAGSTRLKAGTAQKIVLNMLSTTAMILLGKVYDGFMIDLRATNEKLRRRAMRILNSLTGEQPERIRQVLIQTNWQVKPAVLMLKANLNYSEAMQLLEKYDGSLRKALTELGQTF